MIINTVEELDSVRDDLDGNYELGASIDFNDPESYTNPDNMETYTSGEGFEPIGTESEPFTGTFETGLYKIFNLYINRPTADNVGLFGVVENPAQIKCEVRSADIIGDSAVAAVVGLAETDATIINSSATGTIRAADEVGGVAGKSKGTVERCWSGADTISENGNSGSLIGRNDGTLANSFATGQAAGGRRIGGLVGNNQGTIDKCYSSGIVLASTQGGGLVGDGETEDVTNSFWDTEESGYDTSYGGTGKTTEEMLDVDTYTAPDTEGLDDPWDFVDDPNSDNSDNDYWSIDDENQNKNEGYPFLTEISELQEYCLTASIRGEGSVLVNKTAQQEDMCAYVTSGEIALLEAIPATFWEFSQWTGYQESEEEQITITIIEDVDLTATFVYLPKLVEGETYADVIEALEYNSKHGRTKWADLTVEEQEAALRIATEFLNTLRWKGKIADTDQLLDWPREEVVDNEGREINDTEIPDAIKKACAELAYIHAYISPLYDGGQSSEVTSMTAGKLSVNYQNGSSGLQTERTLRGLWDYLRTGIGLQRK